MPFTKSHEVPLKVHEVWIVHLTGEPTPELFHVQQADVPDIVRLVDIGQQFIDAALALASPLPGDVLQHLQLAQVVRIWNSLQPLNCRRSRG